MFDERDEARADTALREGLRDLPVPETSPDFDSRVLDALQSPTPRWSVIWRSLRPVLSTAACSLIVMLAVLHWAAQLPVDTHSTHSSSIASRYPTPADVSALLDSPTLSAASLIPLNAMRWEALTIPARPPADEPVRAEPRRRSESAIRPTV